jgi:hypothetical protein
MRDCKQLTLVDYSEHIGLRVLKIMKKDSKQN